MSDAVHLTIEIAARPATVYRFLVDPEWFCQWMGASSSMATADGAFRVVYPNGDQAVGQILERVDGRRVVYSWGYADAKHGLAPGATRVIFELQESAIGTVLVLRHEGLPTSQLRDNHSQGWAFYTAQLASAAATAQIDPVLPDTVAAYIRGWNESDQTQRARALELSVETDVVYRDRMAIVRGRNALIGHIAGTRAYAPGLTLELVGRVRQSHNYATFDWRITDPSGAAFATGSCYGDVSLDGRFRNVVGFWNA